MDLDAIYDAIFGESWSEFLAFTRGVTLPDLPRAVGVDLSDADVDLYTALVGGLVDSQWANDPGGSRWASLLDRAIDMYADNLDLPREDR